MSKTKFSFLRITDIMRRGCIIDRVQPELQNILSQNMKSGIRKKFLSLANPWLELMRQFLVINNLYRDIKKL